MAIAFDNSTSASGNFYGTRRSHIRVLGCEVISVFLDNGRHLASTVTAMA